MASVNYTEKQLRLLLLLAASTAASVAAPGPQVESSRASERGMRACVHCFAAPFLFDTCLPLPLHYFNLLHHTRTLPVQLKAPSTKRQKDPPSTLTPSSKAQLGGPSYYCCS
jgi:hypothetical protein